jgi:hypothetical protein
MTLNTITHKLNITLPEIFDLVRAQSSQKDKINELKRFSHLKPVRWLANVIYNVDLSKCYVPLYTESSYPPDMTGSLWTQVGRIEAAFKHLELGDTEKYEKNMILALEQMSKEEAELVANVMNQKKIDGITKKVWKEVFPQFFRTEAVD